LAHNYARVFSYRRSALMQRLWSLIEGGLNRPDSAIAITPDVRLSAVPARPWPEASGH
jgi:hypothetical protein